MVMVMVADGLNSGSIVQLLKGQVCNPIHRSLSQVTIGDSHRHCVHHMLQ